MKVVDYLGVNGVMQGNAQMERRFVLPDKINSTCSLRLGAHAFALKETMQILPVGNFERLPKSNAVQADDNGRANKMFKRLFKGCNVRSLLM